MKDDVILYILLFFVIMCLVILLIDWYNLTKFKICYDLNFYEDKCIKYLNY